MCGLVCVFFFVLARFLVKKKTSKRGLRSRSRTEKKKKSSAAPLFQFGENK